MLLRSAGPNDLDRLSARVFDSATRTSGARLDAYRIDETFHIDIDLPGVDPAGVDITVGDKILTVRAERKRAEGENVRCPVAECPAGPVSRQMLLADTLDTDRLAASYENGVLTLSIPVREKARPRQIEVAAIG
jgi:HSP20 family protein